jgi:hypothetical protein
LGRKERTKKKKPLPHQQQQDSSSSTAVPAADPKAVSESRLKRLREQYQREIRTKDGVPLYFTKENITAVFGKREGEKVDVFEQLQTGLDKAQVERRTYENWWLKFGFPFSVFAILLLFYFIEAYF